MYKDGVDGQTTQDVTVALSELCPVLPVQSTSSSPVTKRGQGRIPSPTSSLGNFPNSGTSSGQPLLTTYASYTSNNSSAVVTVGCSVLPPASPGQHYLCGISKWRPGLLQRLACVDAFLVALCCLACLCQALSTGYINSVITTIEKRFEIGSSTAGLIAASYEFGSLVTVVFVSYLGGRRRIPVWIGTGVIIMSLGSLIFTLPQFLGESYSVQRSELTTNASKGYMCRESRLQSASKAASPAAARAGVGELFKTVTQCVSGYSGNGWFVFLFILAQVFIGCGGTPIFTLGTTFLDDHLPKSRAPPRIACVYAAGALGPILGYCLGAVMLQFYVDLFLYDYRDFRLHPRDPLWIGAWWGGFLLSGCLLLPLALVFFLFPRKLPRLPELEPTVQSAPPQATAEAPLSENTETVVSSQIERSEAEPMTPVAVCSDVPRASTTMVEHPVAQTTQEYGKDWKDLPRSLFSLAQNKVYITTCLGICFEASIVSGFCVFLPKYLETQFSVSKSNANFLTGGIAIPGAVFGILIGGYLVQKYHMTKRGAVRLALVMQTISLIGFGLLLWLGCDNIRLAGTTLPYRYYNSTIEDGPAVALSAINLTSSCNQRCHCSPNDLDLVCGADGVTYFSPCYAGCTDFSSSPVHIKTQDLSEPIFAKAYSSCRCVAQSLGPSRPATQNSISTTASSNSSYDNGAPVAQARSGPCPTSCLTLTPFMIMLFLLTSGMSITQMPLLMVTLRSVAIEERAFALGMQFVLLRLIAYIPAPIYFGKVIDSSCSHWKRQCGSRGACLVYDIADFRLKYTGVSVILKAIAIAIFVLVYVFVKGDQSSLKATEDDDAL